MGAICRGRWHNNNNNDDDDTTDHEPTNLPDCPCFSPLLSSLYRGLRANVWPPSRLRERGREGIMGGNLCPPRVVSTFCSCLCFFFHVWKGGIHLFFSGIPFRAFGREKGREEKQKKSASSRRRRESFLSLSSSPLSFFLLSAWKRMMRQKEKEGES